METVYRRTFDSPVGPIEIQGNDQAILKVSLGRGGKVQDKHPLLLRAEKEIQEYFSGKRDTFSVPTEPRGTAFQKQAWKTLRKIGFGKSVTYGELARRCGNPKASRAIGGAMGKNPVPLLIPCHRVLAANRKLGGFTGGIGIKKKLLKHEGIADLS